MKSAVIESVATPIPGERAAHTPRLREQQATPRPRWGALYAILLASVGLCVGGSRLVAAVGNSALIQYGVALAILGLLPPVSTLGQGSSVRATQLTRPFPQLSAVNLQRNNSGRVLYHSLQTRAQKRFSGGLSFAANYTLARSTDDVSNDTRGAGTELVVPSDPKRLVLDKGRSDFDVRHVVRGNFIADLPFGQGRKFLRGASGLLNAIVGGWQVNGVVDASSGYPFSVYSGYHTFTFYDSGTRVATTSGSGTTNRADFKGSSTKIGRVVETDRGVQFFSPEERALFETPEIGTTGSARNLFTGPGFFQIDLGVFKNFSIGRQRVEFRTEVFNLLDTVNFNDPSVLATSGAFGTITDTRVPPRIVQFGLKWYF